jgi:hypothetical protein
MSFGSKRMSYSNLLCIIEISGIPQFSSTPLTLPTNITKHTFCLAIALVIKHRCST